MTFSFGGSTLVDVLSWSIVILLGAKVLATAILLRVHPVDRVATPIRCALWWVTKIAPLAALPCLAALARREGRATDAWVCAGLFVFALVAVPIMIRQRFRPVDPAIRPR